MSENTIIDGREVPWIDTRLPKEIMDHLWDCINHSPQEKPTFPNRGAAIQKRLAGNISKSIYIQDKNNLFYNNILKEMIEIAFYKDWKNYYERVVAKIKPPPIFAIETLWVNYQKQYDFNPSHNHSGLISFVVFMKIPTHWKEQHALPRSAKSNSPRASDFQFQVGQADGSVSSHSIILSPEDEGRMLFFPAWLTHQVYPFYETEEKRITISGNIFIQN